VTNVDEAVPKADRICEAVGSSGAHNEKHTGFYLIFIFGRQFLNGFLGLDWNDKFGVNAKFKCLEKWFRSYASVMIITIYILLGSHPMVIKLSREKTQENYST